MFDDMIYDLFGWICICVLSLRKRANAACFRFAAFCIASTRCTLYIDEGSMWPQNYELAMSASQRLRRGCAVPVAAAASLNRVKRRSISIRMCCHFLRPRSNAFASIFICLHQIATNHLDLCISTLESSGFSINNGCLAHHIA